ncbi:hypothetical protein SESBI_50713 [Sesbania bispinosa]|nr:hypothetical protein SESBI_50713 [Sesbania bispinosa]
MRGGKALRSVRVSESLSREEKDQLMRSTKKAKKNDSQESFVEETQILPEGAQSDAVQKENGGLGSSAEAIPQWESYGDDDDTSDEDTEVNEANMEEDENVGGPNNKSKKRVEDPLCPTIKISKFEPRDMWQPTGSMEMIDLENDYYLLRFSHQEDVSRVFEGGPWMILDHYLMEPTVEEAAQNGGPPAPKMGTTDQQGRVFWLWMIAQRKPRRNPRKPGADGQVNQANMGGKANATGSRFAALMNEETEENLPPILSKDNATPSVPAVQSLKSRDSVQGNVDKAIMAQKNVQIDSPNEHVSPTTGTPRAANVALDKPPDPGVTERVEACQDASMQEEDAAILALADVLVSMDC